MVAYLTKPNPLEYPDTRSVTTRATNAQKQKIWFLLHCMNVRVDMGALFPEAKVLNLPRLCSDHHPIMFVTHWEVVKILDRLFRFEVAWLTHKGFATIFEDAWRGWKNSISVAVNLVTDRVKEWKDIYFGDVFKRKRSLIKRLSGIQCVHYYGSPDFPLEYGGEHNRKFCGGKNLT